MEYLILLVKITTPINMLKEIILPPGNYAVVHEKKE